MAERHTIDFNRFGVNILSDAERGTITLQFEGTIALQFEGTIAFQLDRDVKAIVKAVNGRFGGGVWNRWVRGERDVLKITSSGMPHPENPEVTRVEMIVSRGELMDIALGDLLDFFRRQPGYRRTLGAPLDRDSIDTRVRMNKNIQKGHA
jgi:hypothetical protein